MVMAKEGENEIHLGYDPCLCFCIILLSKTKNNCIRKYGLHTTHNNIKTHSKLIELMNLVKKTHNSCFDAGILVELSFRITFSLSRKLSGYELQPSQSGTLLASYAEITQVIDLKISICFRRKFTKQLAVILRNTREFNDILKYKL
jgi:hypothetical protein